MRMARIYDKAAGVYIWLGEEDATSKLAIELVNKIYDGTQNGDPDKTSFSWTGSWWKDYSFTALSLLMERSWFRRGWVLQEAAFSVNSIIQCGDRQLQLKHFTEVTNLIRSKFNSEPQAPGLLSTKTRIGTLMNFVDSPAVRLLDLIQRSFEKTADGSILHHLMSLEMLVHLATFSETSNEQDTMYTLLNLANDQRSMSRYGQGSVIVPDYTSREKLPYGDPSWRSKHRLHGNPLVGSPLKPTYNADECLSILGDPRKNSGAEYTQEICTWWRTLCADRNGNGDPAPDSWVSAMENLLVMLNSETASGIDIEELLDNDIPELVRTYLLVVRDIVWNRRTFRSDINLCGKQFVGLVPPNARIGDQICILYGCSVPVVLRKLESPDQTLQWQLVGDAYVHGIMDGEFLRGLTGDERIEKEQTFAIR
ncbi:hypothetical protein SNOG_04970 [Parastagonospora nodorum SN15]|uniref:Heterokaryon incompatibility domain-containing protein n=1 Tax=Phaeosphaeria nodorum (strain SN15 / ATCC MYA-4574 / FGSC 10173) TaxID=321614 RepID=Q0UTE4_PHANO|nr:hypothetical protein SNOG_04970 [Parastagonospora nodorum SN15]EAT87361.1 hypothetical protein SNOG_04970 [Parastagonospora nodorum SN15]